MRRIMIRARSIGSYSGTAAPPDLRGPQIGSRSAGSFTLAVVLVVVLCAPMGGRADLIVSPPHPHDPSPVTTFQHDTLPGGGADPTHRHQHRTGHDPLQGTKVHGTGTGAQAYQANLPGQIWVGRTLIVAGGTHPGTNTESEHGHQGHEIDSGRFDVHPATAGGDISAAEAAAWNANALNMANFTFGAWVTAGNASGAQNWPGTDDDEAAGAGVPWHSSIGWDNIAFDPAQAAGSHEVHVSYGEAGGTALANTFPFTPGHNSVLNIVVDDDQPFFYGTVGNPAATEYDFATVLLHEVGHVVGLDHFGAGNLSYIMRPTFGLGEVTRVIDPDAVHGVRDLYAISVVPEPSSLALMGSGALSLFGYGLRRRRAARAS